MLGEGRSPKIPLASVVENRFDISQMASDSDRANRKLAWVGIGVAIGASAILGFFAVIFVLAGYTYPVSFVVYSVFFGLLIAIGLYAYQLARVPRSPVGVSVGPKEVRFDYPGSTSKAVSWVDTGNLVWLLDQRKRASRKFVVGSDFGCKIKGGRRVVGGLGFSPISSAAFGAVLSQAREQGVSIDTHPLSLGRGGTVRDVTVHRLYRSSR